MPRRLVRTLAYHHPGLRQRDESLPTRTMWVDSMPEGTAALAGHPVFQAAPLGDIREQMLRLERRTVKEVRLVQGGPVEALIWKPFYWHREERFTLARPVDAWFDPYQARNARPEFSPYCHWIGMTRDRVWTTGGGERDHMVLGAYVQFLEKIDLHGRRLPPEPQGAIPDEDEDALSSLA